MSRQIESGKQEMARVNIDILGISELKWTGMGAFNSNDNYIYYFHRELPQDSYPYESEGRQNENHNHRKLTRLMTLITTLSNSMKL